MADDLEDVMAEYGIEGLDPSMVKGAVVPPLDKNEGLKEKIQKDIAKEKASVAVAVDVVSQIPPGPMDLTKISEQVKLVIPEVSEIRKAITNPAANDKLVEVIRKDESTVTLLNTVMEEIAEEAAYLKAWRNQVWDGQEDISEATLSRIKMLSELVKTLSEREKLKKDKNVGKVDFHSENFQNVLKYFMSVIMTTFKKVQIPKQYEDIFAAQLAKDFDGFEKKAEKIYYGKGK